MATFEEVSQWGEEDVNRWLHSIRLGDHTQTFSRNDISGAVLFDVDLGMLKEMGIPSVGARTRLLSAIKNLKRQCAERAQQMQMQQMQQAHQANEAGAETLNSHQVAVAALAARRSAQTRPPPLHLAQSSTSDMPLTPSQASPLHNNSSNSHGLGLREARGLTGTGQGRIGRSPASMSKALPGDERGHRKVSSIGGAATMNQRNVAYGSRPSTASGGYGYPQGHPGSNGDGSGAVGGGVSVAGAGSSSRYAGMSSSSPTGQTFSSYGQPRRPSTSDGAARPVGTVHNANSPLTPIVETNSATTSAISTRSPVTPSFNRELGGYAVGRGPFTASSARPITPSYAANSNGPPTPNSASSDATMISANINKTGGNSAPHPSLEDLKRRTIKFIGEDGTTRIVTVSDCRDAHEVLSKVLKKFGKPSSGNSYQATPTADRAESEDEHSGEEGGTGELWGIFATSGDGQTKYLNDNELLAICHAPQPHDPLRERGLTLRRVAQLEDPSKRQSKRNKLQYFFGDLPPGASSGSGPASPGPESSGRGIDGNSDAGHVTTGGKKMNRASTISIMTGLGVNVAKGGFSAAKNAATASRGGGHAHHAGSAARVNENAQWANSTTSLPTDRAASHDKLTMTMTPAGVTPEPSKAASVIPRKARNFFGQRPPSELISSHLTDYFPATEKRVLERTARRSIYGRPSTSIRSKRDSTWSFAADPDAPPLPGKESIDVPRPSVDAPSIKIGSTEESLLDSSRVEQAAPKLPPVVDRSSLDEWAMDLATVGAPNQANPDVMPPPVSRPQRPVSHRRASGESSRSRKSLATQLRMARGIGGGNDDYYLGGPLTDRSSQRGIGADRSDTASLLTVDEITQEVEQRRASTSLASNGPADGSGGWVVDEDGVPIPLPAATSNRAASSIAASTRPSSGLSVGMSGSEDGSGDDDGDVDDDENSDVDPTIQKVAVIGFNERGNSAKPAEGADRFLNDTLSVSPNSRTSSISGKRRSGSDEEKHDGMDTEDDYDDEDDVDDLSDDDDDDDDEDKGGVYQSRAPGKEPIKWIKGALIGAGSFGNVFLGMNAKNGLLMAVKQVELPSGDSHNDQRKKSMLEALEREIELLKTMEHENIVQYLDSYADGTHLNIFLEYVPGGSVVALLRNYGAFEEPLVRNFVKQILHGLAFLHEREIVHRDIKGANILVDNKSCIKISDFGISKKVESDLLVSARAHRPSLQGSVFWMAPEVVKQTSYTRKADIWSLGCLVVEMISGTHPWANLNQMQALFKIGSLAKPSLPDEISAAAVDFLNKTFELDYNKRPSAEELLKHPFITEEFVRSSSVEGSTSTFSGGAMTSGDEIGSTASQNSAVTTATSAVSGTMTNAAATSSSAPSTTSKNKGKGGAAAKRAKAANNSSANGAAAEATPTAESANVAVTNVSPTDSSPSTAAVTATKSAN